MKKYLSLVKFSHTIFALPFALLGFTLAVVRYGSENVWYLLLLVLLCMVLARSAAMAFNRYLDRDIDKKNPRTQGREIPAGIISPGSALTFTIICALGFILTTYFINPLCFYLSPVALLVVLGYSYTKRFTSICHFVLGIGLGLAPVGAYISVSNQFDWIPVLIGSSVLFWVGGFDIIYALQDEEFDQSLGLYSIPASLGRKRALLLSRAIHILSGLLMVVAIVSIGQTYMESSWLKWLALGVFVSLLVYQQLQVSVDDLSRINLAFFTSNGIASVVFGALVIIDLLI